MRRRPYRFALSVLLVGAAALSLTTARAQGQSLETLRERMDALQEELDATTAKIEEMRTAHDNLTTRIRTLDGEIARIESRNRGLQERVVQRARILYMSGSSGMLEVLLTAEDLGELTDEIEFASRVSQASSRLFLRYSRMIKTLSGVRLEAQQSAEELADVTASLSSESQRLQAQFSDASDDYERLKRELLAQAERPQSSADTSGDALSQSAFAAPLLSVSGMTCPIDGPNSFIDSWGYPRSGGRSHEGADMMAAEGTSVVAITDGTVTYAGYGSSAGNWIILSGADGNSYWYLHNRANLVTGGRVQAGQQIATVGNTGNASGGPTHVHFEYHPSGGGPINPYPLVAGLC